MAAPLVQRVELDAASAQRQLALLERQLDTLNNPVNVPVNIEGGEADFAALARSLGISEEHARGLTAEFNQSRVKSREVETAVKGVAQALGLSERDARDLARQLQSTEQSAEETANAMLRVGTRGVSAFTNLRGSIVGVAAALGVIQGARILGNFALDAIQQASNLQESLSKTNVVFGEFSDDIQAFASTGPEALGLSTQAALEATSTFGNLFTALGLTQEAAADLSPDVIQLASDLASFNNIAVDEAVEKLRAGLVGEVEPLRTLGVNLNAALVEAKALELGLVDSAGAATEAGKVQARYALILEQTSNAQGDFARTADGVANRQRTLAAQFQNLQAQIGEALLPAFEALLAAGPSLIALIEGIVPAVQSAATSFADFVGTIQPFLDMTTQIQQGFGAFGDILTGISTPARQSLEILTSLVTLQFDDTIANLGELGTVYGDLTDRLQDRSAIIGLADDLAAGLDPAQSFVDRLHQVAEQNDITAGTFERLTGAAGLSSDELIEALRGIRDNADAYDLDAQAVQFLNDELERLLFLQQGFGRRQPGRPEGAGPLFFAPERTEAEIAAFEAQIAGLPDIIKGGLDQAQREAAADAEAFAQGFADDLSSSFSAAMTDAEGELEDDASDFVQRFIEKVNAEVAFESNLAEIRAAGGVLLEAFLRGEGVERGSLLAADFLEEPGEIAKFEEAGRERGVALATGELEAFLAEIEAADFSSVAVDEVSVPVVADLTAFLASLEGLTGIVDFSVAVPVAPVPGGGGGGGGGNDGGGGGRSGPQSTTTVTQNFYTEPQPTTTTQRAAQEINSIVANTRS